MIDKLKAEYIALMVDAFKNLGWNKPASIFETYLNEQEQHARFVWVAFQDSAFAGYVTLKLQSEYDPFRQNHIPEINDLNVLPQFRNQGIGTALLDLAEGEGKKHSNVVGIGVGLYADYGHAQRLYAKRGYIPDGKGITYEYKRVTPGQAYKVDDDLILWFTKSVDPKN